jgi:uncharacterized protein (TIGR03435 family)
MHPILLALLTSLVITHPAWPDDLLAFEAASIHPIPPGQGDGKRSPMTGGPGTKDPTHFSWRNCKLLWLMTKACQLKNYQLSGPGWLNTQRIDLTANVPAGVSRADFRVMLQHLLAERFDCGVHWDTKELAIYRLIESKQGRKFKDAAPPVVSTPAASSEKPPELKLGSDGYPDLRNQSVESAAIGNRVRFRLANASVSDLIIRLEDQVDLPVLDGTGLQGRYDFTLSWIASERFAVAMAVSDQSEAASSAATDDLGPTLFEALERQLGLRLEQTKGPVKVLVVDHMKQLPTEN